MTNPPLLRIGWLRAMRNVPQLLTNPIPLMRKCLREGNGIFQTYLGTRPICLTDLPEAALHILQKNHRNYRKPPKTYGALARFIGNGLLTSEGHRWKTHRKMIQPGFHPKRIAGLAGVMVDETNATLEQIAGRREPVDWAAATVELTARIIGRTLFSDQLQEAEIQRARLAIKRAERMVVGEVRSRLVVAFDKLTGRKARMLREIAAIRESLLGYISARSESGSERNDDDLIQMLLEARFADSGEGLSPEDLLDEALTFYVAGHETSSHALAWFVYETGQRPELRKHLREEAEQAAPGRDAGLEDLASMPLLLSTLKETLRLHPPAWIVDRESVEEDTIAGHPFPGGMLVAVCLFSLHRREALWKDPEDFLPDRFLDPAVKEEFWMPFGAGPRKCIGQHFAMMEMQLVAAQLLKRLDFRVLNAAEIAPKALVTMGMNRPLVTEFFPPE